MLTLEETRASLNIFKALSILNVLPIGVDVKSGKIQRQSNRVKFFIWRVFLGLGVSHWLYIFGRLVQSTVIDRKKYFRWDHFVLHFGMVSAYGVLYFTGYRLFVKNPEENVMVFNQLFSEREDPVKKMMDQQLEIQRKSGNGKGKRANKTPGKSGKVRLASTSTSTATEEPKPTEEIQMQVIENRFESESESNSEVGARARPLLTWPPQYSLDELMAKFVPLSLILSGFCSVLIFASDPSRCHLLYSSLPPEWQNVSCFLVFLAVEAFCIFLVDFIASFSLTTQLLFFAKCQLEFKRMSLQLRSLEDKFQNGVCRARHIEREIWILRQILKEMREVVVLVELFNCCFPLCIFAWKLCSLSVSIVCYFFVIRHSSDFPILAFFSGYLAVILTLLYTIMYAHAFSIPQKMDLLKKEFLLTAQKTIANASNFNGNKILRAEMEREIWSIRGVGVKVGGFHTLERESTPSFIDFVLRNVVTLLVTIPR